MKDSKKIIFTQKDIDCVKRRYSKRYDEFGYSPKTLGWIKGKQDIRFNSLTSRYNFENKHILDIGSGFGDLVKTLSAKTNSYKYTGVELVEEFIVEAKKRYQGNNIKFINANILEYEFDEIFDFAIASGIFNYRLSNDNNYEFVEQIIQKTLEMTKDGLAFDFLSDKVDFIKYDYTFHNSPEKILEIAYKFSRNVIIKNDYMPFEFTLFIFKDDSFDKDDTIFNRFKEENNSLFG